jgi:hypothetical protein
MPHFILNFLEFKVSIDLNTIIHMSNNGIKTNAMNSENIEKQKK